MNERTLAIIKPDAVQDKVMGKIISIIEESGLEIVAAKMVHLDINTVSQFYAVHKGKPFYERLVGFMSEGPSMVLVLQGKDAVVRWRDLMGSTDPLKAQEGTIRRKFGTEMPANATHGSDSPETAGLEISFFFSALEMP